MPISPFGTTECMSRTSVLSPFRPHPFPPTSMLTNTLPMPLSEIAQDALKFQVDSAPLLHRTPESEQLSSGLILSQYGQNDERAYTLDSRTRTGRAIFLP